jgi:cytochrome P450
VRVAIVVASSVRLATCSLRYTVPKSLVFGAGPRFCPGRNLAFLESKTALAMIARNFQIEDSGGQVKERFSFAVIPDGLSVRMRERTTQRPLSAD